MSSPESQNRSSSEADWPVRSRRPKSLNGLYWGAGCSGAIVLLYVSLGQTASLGANVTMLCALWFVGIVVWFSVNLAAMIRLGKKGPSDFFIGAFAVLAVAMLIYKIYERLA